MLSKEEIKKRLREEFSFDPTADQQQFFEEFSDYLLSRDSPKAFVLKGYAGTGKTTLITAINRFVRKHGYDTLLLAPTGRAAKVMSGYSGQMAHTIHRSIYFQTRAADGSMILTLAQNQHQHCFIIVDEAGMISSNAGTFTGSGSSRYLLDDLIQYVYSGSNCHLILCGDTAQLPPVGESHGVALSENHLKKEYFLHVHSHELREVVRQEKDSGILNNATQLRLLIQEESEAEFEPDFGLPDFGRLNGTEFMDEIERAYSAHGHEGVCIITRSNKRANLFNQEVRNRLLYREHELDAGDLMMIVKNNYLWTKDVSDWPFLANGEIIQIQKVNQREQLYELDFADVEVVFPSYDTERSFSLKIMLNAIQSEQAALPEPVFKKLYEDVLSDHMLEHTKATAKKETINDPYFNALQVKFAYAFTCHKTQGGQWPIVFIDASYMNPETHQDNLRWLYTAITRATQQVYLVGWPEK